MTRLEKIVGKDTFEYIFEIYKDAKQRHDPHKLLTVKSFVTKMIEAQSETAIHDGKCHKQCHGNPWANQRYNRSTKRNDTIGSD